MKADPGEPVYSALPNERAIRLLRIEPGQPGNPIQCRLEVYDSIRAAPAYECLSYVWGSLNTTKLIELNGRDKLVGENLFHALNRLRPRPQKRKINGIRDGMQRLSAFRKANRRSWGTRNTVRNLEREPAVLRDVSHEGLSDGLVWIDAVCINQDDLTERGHQVEHMDSIYQGAKRVIIWLGTEDAGVPEAMLLLRQIALLPDWQVPQAYPDRLGDHHERRLVEVYRLPPEYSRTWSILTAVLLNPWFRRVWVLQEFAVARAYSMFIGRYWIDGRALEAAVDKIRDHRVLNLFPKDDELLRSANEQQVLFWQWYITRFRDSSYLSDFFWVMPALEATDPRDRIFGVLFMLRTNQKSTIPALLRPDYTKTKWEVYRDATRYVLSTSKSLNCLQKSLGPSASVEEHKCASWAMDLDLTSVISYPRGPIDASNSTPFTHQESGDPNELIVTGFPIDHIRFVHENLVGGLKFSNFLGSTQVPLEVPEAVSEDFLPAIVKALWTCWRSDFLSVCERRGHDSAKAIRDLLMLCGTTVNRQEWDALPSHFKEGLIFLVEHSREVWIFRTNEDRLGIGSAKLAAGDQILVLHGGQCLSVIRPRGDYAQYIGWCFIEGYMNGERVEQARKSGEQPLTIRLR